MRKHKGFSLIEVIFVLVILGIVASIGSSILVQVYENYIIQRAVYDVNTKTELASTQIVNRLSYHIQGTALSKDHDKYLKHYTHGTTIEHNDSIALSEIPVGGSKYTSIEWIGYDNDSYNAYATPTWSGVANYTTEGGASVKGFVTPGSHLNEAATIINNLSGGKVDLTQNHPAAVLFYQKNNYYKTGETYDYQCMGLIPEVDTNTSCIFPVFQNGTNGLTFTRAKDPNNDNNKMLPKIITERYKLAWSAYALAPERNNKGQYDLMLYYNYQPWNGENYIQNGTKTTIMKNITVFKFSETAGVIQFKLCATEAISKDMNVSSCKEKVVIR